MCNFYNFGRVMGMSSFMHILVRGSMYVIRALRHSVGRLIL